MEKLGAGPEKGLLLSHLVPGSAELHLQVSHLAANHEHIVCGDGVEFARFTTNASGGALVAINLFATGNVLTPTFDPRDKFITVNDGTNDMLAAWVYANPSNDPPRPRLSEVTSLARAGTTQGTVDARYDRLPNGNQRLTITMHDLAPGDYEVIIDDVVVTTVTPNRAGLAVVNLSTGGTMGGSPHNVRGPLTIDPRDETIKVKINAGGTEYSGKMLAQIPGL